MGAGSARRHPELLPNGVDNGGLVRRNVWTWNDQWTFTAAGVPSVYFVTKDATYRGAWYHTQLDTMALIDWSYLAKNAKLYGLLQQGLDSGVLPYDFRARADAVRGQLRRRRPDRGRRRTPPTSTSSARASRRSLRPAMRGRPGAARSPAPRVRHVNRQLMRAEKVLNGSLTGLDQWDSTVYPHVQLLDDVSDLNGAIAGLDADPVDAAGGAGRACPTSGRCTTACTSASRCTSASCSGSAATTTASTGAASATSSGIPTSTTPGRPSAPATTPGRASSIVEMRDGLLVDLDASLTAEAAALDAATAILEDVTP